MGILFGKTDIDDKDLAVIKEIVIRVCKSIDNVAESMLAIAKAVESKKLRLD